VPVKLFLLINSIKRNLIRLNLGRKNNLLELVDGNLRCQSYA